MTDFLDIYFTAMKASIRASKEIMKIYQTAFDPIIKADGSPVTKADLSSSEIISHDLQSTAIPIIGEETVKAPFEERATWKQVWIVDPLDGTKEFIKKNGEFAVNIALVENNKPVFGLIASPVKEEILIGGPSIGAFIVPFDSYQDSTTWKKLKPRPLNSPLVLAGSRSHHSGKTIHLINELKAKFNAIDFIKKGSALKFFDLAKGDADVYPRFAPTMEWDIAAGQAILEALGGTVVHAEKNEPLYYNKANLYNPYFIAKTKEYIAHE